MATHDDGTNTGNVQEIQLYNLGAYYVSMGQYEKAVSLLKPCLQIRETNYGMVWCGIVCNLMMPL